jgi:hypothetical protein
LADLGVLREDVAIHFLELAVRDAVGRGVEIVEVGEEITQRVADLPVRFDRAREDLVAHPDLFAVVAH